LPVYFTWHPGETPKGIVHVTSGEPYSFSGDTYLTISVPTVKEKPSKKRKK
jgi:hypothetical protein